MLDSDEDPRYNNDHLISPVKRFLKLKGWIICISVENFNDPLNLCDYNSYFL